jgi:hypothetical protein
MARRSATLRLFGWTTGDDGRATRQGAATCREPLGVDATMPVYRVSGIIMGAVALGVAPFLRRKT